MARVSIEVRLPKLPNMDFDLTPEFKIAADVIAAEMRGNITKGVNVDELSPLRPNAPSVARRKFEKFGHARPLIAEHRKFIEKASYIIRVIRRNFVQLSMSQSVHPDSKISIARLGQIHNDGEGRKHKREFWGVSPTAFKRIRSKIADRITRLLK